MAQSLTKIIIHVIYGTKNREPFLSKEIRSKLYAYTVGILDNQHCITLAINGVENHLHLLVILSKNIAVSKIVEEIKRGTSRWLKTQGTALTVFHGKADTERFLSANHKFPKSLNTSITKNNIIKKFRFKMN
jgi:REP element-mobilizing transposase RayT